jgi:hypothetical protein
MQTFKLHAFTHFIGYVINKYFLFVIQYFNIVVCVVLMFGISFFLLIQIIQFMQNHVQKFGILLLFSMFMGCMFDFDVEMWGHVYSFFIFCIY